MHFQLEPEIKQCWRKSNAPNGGALGARLLINTGLCSSRRELFASEWQKCVRNTVVISYRSTMHLKAVVKKLSAIRQGTWRVHNQCNLLKRTGLCNAAAWCWWKEKLCSQSPAPPTLCCIYIWSRETRSKTEFLWKVHNSALFETGRLFGNALLSRREDLIFFALLFFLLLLLRSVCLDSSVSPSDRTQANVRGLPLTQSTLTVHPAQRETLIRAPPPQPSPARQSKSGRSWTERKEEIALIEFMASAFMSPHAWLSVKVAFMMYEIKLWRNSATHKAQHTCDVFSAQQLRQQDPFISPSVINPFISLAPFPQRLHKVKANQIFIRLVIKQKAVFWSGSARAPHEWWGK